MEDGHLGVLGQVVQNYAQLMEVMLLNVIGSVTCRHRCSEGKHVWGIAQKSYLLVLIAVQVRPISLFVYLKIWNAFIYIFKYIHDLTPNKFLRTIRWSVLATMEYISRLILKDKSLIYSFVCRDVNISAQIRPHHERLYSKVTVEENSLFWDISAVSTRISICNFYLYIIEFIFQSMVVWKSF